MGYRLHIVKKYEIDYDLGQFNHLYDDFLDYIIDEVDQSVFEDSVIELYIGTVRDYVKKLQTKSEVELNKTAFGHITYKELLDFWRKAINMTDRDGRDYIRLEWF